MRLPGCVIIERSSDWLIAVGSETEHLALDAEPIELAQCAERMVGRKKKIRHGCVLAPDSTSCFFATLTLGEEVDVRDRTALVYELEDHLPIDAESMVADFMVLQSSRHGKAVAGIAIETDRWRRIVHAMESVGLPVRSIVPRAVLVTRAVLATRAARKKGSLSDAIDMDPTTQWLLVDEDQCDAIRLKDQTISLWKHFAINHASLRRHALLDQGGVQQVVVVGAGASQRSTITEVYSDARFLEDDGTDLVVQGAAMRLSDRSYRGFDLCRGALGPSDPLTAIQTQVRLVAVAAAMFFLVLALGGWWRASRIEQEIANIRAEETKLFREAFPGSRVPGALVRRVRSEHTKVLGSRGKSSEVDIPLSAPMVLRELISALPRSVRFRITSIKILDGEVSLDLQVRSPVDAGTLAASLSAAGFDVDPPGTTQKDAATFESLLEARWTGQPKIADSPEADLSINLTFFGEVSG